jgi:hypothetical protein
MRATAEELGTGPVTVPLEEIGGIGKITLFEALSQDIDPDSLDLSNSNHTTQPPADYDDQ